MAQILGTTFFPHTGNRNPIPEQRRQYTASLSPKRSNPSQHQLPDSPHSSLPMALMRSNIRLALPDHNS
ncbi:hypothetical protein BDV93DRAFT_519322, partial [Ceratobasidium sp. AG-I]